MSAKTTTAVDQLAIKGTERVHTAKGSRAAGVGHFVRHFFEMCVAMCLGTFALDPVYKWVGGLAGYDPYVQLPELSALVLAFNMTAPMVVWMRIRGMQWRHINEMSATMLVEAVLIVGAYWLGIVSNVNTGGTTSLWLLQHGLMMPVMIVPMLFRLDVYTGNACHSTR